MKNPFFSIVVISLNAEKTISETVSSILSQNFENFEIVIKDGMSTDNTLQSVPSNDHIKIYAEKDNGIYDAMNQAISYCNGDYVFFLNCGDLFFDEFVLQNAYNGIIKKPDCCLYGDFFDTSSQKFVKQDYSLCKYFWFRTTLCHQSVFFKRDFLNENSFDTSFKIAADFVLMFSLYKNGTLFCYEPFVVSKYDRNGVSSTKNGRKINKLEKKRFIKTNFTPYERFVFSLKSIFSRILKKRY